MIAMINGERKRRTRLEKQECFFSDLSRGLTEVDSERVCGGEEFWGQRPVNQRARGMALLLDTTRDAWRWGCFFFLDSALGSKRNMDRCMISFSMYAALAPTTMEPNDGKVFDFLNSYCAIIEPVFIETFSRDVCLSTRTSPFRPEMSMNAETTRDCCLPI